MIAGTVLCPRCRMVNLPLDGRLLCYGCLRDLGQLVPGEEEVGLQHWCGPCDSWWPITAEFWYVVRYNRGDLHKVVRGVGYVRESSGASLRCNARHRRTAEAAS